ncbi:Uma2 family endonuclease [Trichormus variabilis FSR]|uniref:Uma2 family endonuclease n=1 Tax=Anabaena variabilis TaxID=264691 RepID=UPI0016231EAC|nr:Uma2 family endonuclease [Trichormus variabilis]MBC1268956.1 Uma2 family endonuclease [Trichormus variabilis FSR]
MSLSTPVFANKTLEEFLKLPKTKPASEYIDGKIYQKLMPQGEHSTLQSSLVTAINEIAKPQKLAYAFPELRCTFSGNSIVPDIAVFEWSRIPLLPNGRIANKFEISPDWIIEILSPEQSPNRVIRKIMFSMQNGAKLGWFLDPNDESIMVFQPDILPEIKAGKEILPVMSVLANWQLTVEDIFSCLNFS